MSDMAFRYIIFAGSFTLVQWLVQSPSVAFNTTMIMGGVVPIFWYFNTWCEKGDE